MPRGRFELPRPCGHKILSHARLPIPPPRLFSLIKDFKLPNKNNFHKTKKDCLHFFNNKEYQKNNIIHNKKPGPEFA